MLPSGWRRQTPVTLLLVVALVIVPTAGPARAQSVPAPEPPAGEDETPSERRAIGLATAELARARARVADASARWLNALDDLLELRARQLRLLDQPKPASGELRALQDQVTRAELAVDLATVALEDADLALDDAAYRFDDAGMALLGRRERQRREALRKARVALIELRRHQHARRRAAVKAAHRKARAALAEERGRRRAALRQAHQAYRAIKADIQRHQAGVDAGLLDGWAAKAEEWTTEGTQRLTWLEVIGGSIEDRLRELGLLSAPPSFDVLSPRKETLGITLELLDRAVADHAASGSAETARWAALVATWAAAAVDAVIEQRRWYHATDEVKRWDPLRELMVDLARSYATAVEAARLRVLAVELDDRDLLVTVANVLRRRLEERHQRGETADLPELVRFLEEQLREVGGRPAEADGDTGRDERARWPAWLRWLRDEPERLSRELDRLLADLDDTRRAAVAGPSQPSDQALRARLAYLDTLINDGLGKVIDRWRHGDPAEHARLRQDVEAARRNWTETLGELGRRAILRARADPAAAEQLLELLERQIGELAWSYGTEPNLEALRTEVADLRQRLEPYPQVPVPGAPAVDPADPGTAPPPAPAAPTREPAAPPSKPGETASPEPGETASPEPGQAAPAPEEEPGGQKRGSRPHPRPPLDDAETFAAAPDPVGIGGELGPCLPGLGSGGRVALDASRTCPALAGNDAGDHDSGTRAEDCLAAELIARMCGEPNAATGGATDRLAWPVPGCATGPGRSGVVGLSAPCGAGSGQEIQLPPVEPPRFDLPGAAPPCAVGVGGLALTMDCPSANPGGSETLTGPDPAGGLLGPPVPAPLGGPWPGAVDGRTPASVPGLEHPALVGSPAATHEPAACAIAC